MRRVGGLCVRFVRYHAGVSMPFKPWVRNISPLAWVLGVSAVANIITMMAVLYLAFGTPKVYVRDGSNSAGSPARVPVIPR